MAAKEFLSFSYDAKSEKVIIYAFYKGNVLTSTAKVENDYQMIEQCHKLFGITEPVNDEFKEDAYLLNKLKHNSLIKITGDGEKSEMEFFQKSEDLYAKNESAETDITKVPNAVLSSLSIQLKQHEKETQSQDATKGK